MRPNRSFVAFRAFVALRNRLHGAPYFGWATARVDQIARHPTALTKEIKGKPDPFGRQVSLKHVSDIGPRHAFRTCQL
jgi:hypothetical protein